MKKNQKSKKRVAFEMAYAASLGIGLAFAIFASLWFGVYLDKKLGTEHNQFAILFLFIGIFAGFKNFYTFIKRYFPDKTEERADEIKEGTDRKGHTPKKD